jgi:CRP-like cAMP-binding protein
MQTHDMKALLAAHPLLAGFDAETVAQLAGCARNLTWRAGETIFREGDPADRAFILRAGDVAVEIAAPGRAPMVVETLHPGDVLGWSWLTPPHRAMADARAMTDVRAIALDAACLRRKCDESPALGYQMFKAWLPHLAARMKAQRLQMLDLYGADAG